MTNPTVWHGTRDEFWQLSAAVERYCACTRGPFRSVKEVCQPHAMLLEQRVLDHLLYVYRSRERFLRAERAVDGDPGLGWPQTGAGSWPEAGTGRHR
jgi:hypothetical protein